jgi:hypothetical protein
MDVEGKASLPVEDDSFMGNAATLVVMDSHGAIIVKMPTTVGGE